MTNLKKLGLTALAGSLVATTAYAGALDVSGAAKVSYSSGNNGADNGNPFSMTRDITFSGSGEMDNGMTISYFQMLSAGSISSLPSSRQSLPTSLFHSPKKSASTPSISTYISDLGLSP